MFKWMMAGLSVYAVMEVVVMVEAGRRVGISWLLGWVLFTAVVGLALLRVLGLRAIVQISHQLEQEVLPTRALVDLALIVSGALLLIAPGIISDFVGLALLFPPTRWLLDSLAFKFLQERFPEQDPNASLRSAAQNVMEIEREPLR